MASDVDLLILGGGCAGLSLAMRLAGRGQAAPRILILERRSRYDDDRTWCFWDDGSMGLDHLVRHRWSTTTIRTRGATVHADCGKTPYQILGAGAFYAEAQSVIAASPRMKITLGAQIICEPRKVGDIWRVETGTGAITASMVVDTRPSRLRVQGGATLWQSFYGREIECDEPAFDPSRADLMDFTAIDRARIQFTYMLPVSSTRALIETTVFDAKPLGPGDLSADLDRAIASRTAGCAVRIVREEQGILPMGVSKPRRRNDPTYIAAGLDAGGARPSSGYAFRRIQLWAGACAKAIGEGKPPIGHAEDPLLLRIMDGLFLSVLRNRPETAPELFLSLFKKADTKRMIRFMSKGGSLLDYAAVASALPTTLFLGRIPGAFNDAMRARSW